MDLRPASYSLAWHPVTHPDFAANDHCQEFDFLHHGHMCQANKSFPLFKSSFPSFGEELGIQATKMRDLFSTVYLYVSFEGFYPVRV